MEIGGVLGDFGQRIIDLPVDDRVRIGIAILQRDAGALAERHLPVAIERAARIDADGERTHLRVAPPAAGEEIAERRLDGRLLLAVPIDAQDEVAPADSAGVIQICWIAPGPSISPKRDLLARLDAHRGRNLPAAAEAARVDRAGPFRRHAAAALLAGEVLRADRARFRRRTGARDCRDSCRVRKSVPPSMRSSRWLT